MKPQFHLLDLRDQQTAVRQLLQNKSVEEKLEWLKLHGEIVYRKPYYDFRAFNGRECVFYFTDDGELEIPHTHV